MAYCSRPLAGGTCEHFCEAQNMPCCLLCARWSFWWWQISKASIYIQYLRVLILCICFGQQPPVGSSSQCAWACAVLLGSAEVEQWDSIVFRKGDAVAEPQGWIQVCEANQQVFLCWWRMRTLDFSVLWASRLTLADVWLVCAAGAVGCHSVWVRADAVASLLVGRANEQISHIFHSEFPVMICISTTSSSGWKTGSSQNFHSHWQCVEGTGTLESGKQAVERFLERVIPAVESPADMVGLRRGIEFWWWPCHGPEDVACAWRSTSWSSDAACPLCRHPALIQCRFLGIVFCQLALPVQIHKQKPASVRSTDLAEWWPKAGKLLATNFNLWSTENFPSRFTEKMKQKHIGLTMSLQTVWGAGRSCTPSSLSTVALAERI